MKDILITGSGMVGSALMQHAPDFGFEAHLLSHQQVDITDQATVERAVLATRPETIFHTAAETRVDYCETHAEQALQVNSMGTMHVRNAANKCGAKLVYLSTDYVFSGKKSSPWIESDEPAPVNAYGISKLAGEWATSSYDLGYLIRTSGVFGPRRDGKPERNFFKTIAAKLAADNRAIEVVDDQATAVTYAPHLARMILELAVSGFPPVAHLTSAGENTWYGWALRATALLGLDQSRIQPVPTSGGSGKAAAPRPHYSVLGSESEAINELVSHYPAEDGLKEYLVGLD